MVVPINISTLGCKLIETGMTNIYWTKIKLPTVANQAIYLGSRNRSKLHV